MKSKNIDWLKLAIEGLTPEQRLELDDHLMASVAKDAELASREYDIVLSTEYVEEATELRKMWGKMQGISSGYPSIDRMTKGFVNGELVIVGGATSNGKTTLAVNMAARMLRSGYSVLFVTMEMTRAQLTSRMMYVQDEFVDYASMLSYQKSDEFNWKSVDGLIDRAKNEMQVDIVIVDHLHHFTRELNNVSEDLGRITKEFQKNAHRHNIPIIVISHTRKGEGRSIDDLRGSSYIAQDADIVLMVSREETSPHLIEVSIKKNRNRGFEVGKDEVLLAFDKTKITERELAEVPKFEV